MRFFIAGRRRASGNVAVFSMCCWFVGVDTAHGGWGASGPVDRGRQLFVMDWKPNAEESPTGDGLGPLFNDVSCAACHEQGGVGGAGDSDHNVLLLTRLTPVASTIRSGASSLADVNAASPLGGLHPAFEDRQITSIVLHARHTHPLYKAWRRDILDSATKEPPQELNLPHGTGLRFIERDGIQYMLSERSTPSLFGAGLINRISAEALRAEAARQARDQDPIAGRVPAVGDNVGRFGWRGQIASLRAFVAGACANELGLTVDDHRQAPDPFDAQGIPPRVDLEMDDVNALTQFIAELPQPRETVERTKEVARGRLLFQRTGCVKCHAEELDGVAGIYSDLLLHDLGPQLTDIALPTASAPLLAQVSVPAQPAESLFRAVGAMPGAQLLSAPPTSLASYYGAPSSSSLASVSSAWRTPPLWGVAETAPYLHDGRAASLSDAILWHEGEASGVTARYRKLPRIAKQSLIAYLETLATP